ncbi:MAG: carbohydrate kinase family protein [Promethearchaeota archaeon]
MVKELDVICIGAALIDMVAKVERYPLDDDEVFVSELKLFSGGAAANTAFICGKLGLKVSFIGKLGSNDEFGKKLIRDFKSVSVDTSLIKYSKRLHTGSSFIALNPNGERRIYAYSGAANELSNEDIIQNEIIKSKVIYLSSLKNLEPLKKASKIARNNKIFVILNPGMLIIEQGFNNLKEIFSNTDILIISKREFLSLYNLSEKDLNSQLIMEKSQFFFNLGIQIVIVTLGKDGAFVLNRQMSEIIRPIEIDQVIDTTGAGDAFSAGFIYGFINNISLNLREIISDVKVGNYLAGKCIQKLGARNGIPDIIKLPIE